MSGAKNDPLSALVEEFTKDSGQVLPPEFTRPLGLLHDLALHLPVTQSRKELYDFVGPYLLEHFGFINVGFFNKETERVTLDTIYGAYEAFIEETGGYSRGQGIGIAGQVVDTGQSLLVNDTRNYPGFEFFPDRERDPARAELDVPMHHQDQVLGCMGLQRDTPNSFTPMDIYAMEAVGAMVGSTLARLQSFEELEKAALNRDLMGKVRTRYMGNMAHELKTPIAVVRGYLEIMEMGKLGPISDRQGKILETCLRHMDRLTDLLDQTLGFMSSGWEAQEFTVVDIGACFQEMVGDMPEDVQKKFNIDARIDGSVICQKKIVANSLGSFLSGHGSDPDVNELSIQVLDYKNKYFRIRIECNDGPPRETLRGILPARADGNEDWEEQVADMRQVFFSLGGYMETEGPRERGWALNCYMPIWKESASEPVPPSPE